LSNQPFSEKTSVLDFIRPEDSVSALVKNPEPKELEFKEEVNHEEFESHSQIPVDRKDNEVPVGGVEQEQ